MDYRFRVEEPTIIPASLTLGNTINDSIVNVGDRLVYTFNGNVGQRLIYDGISGDYNLDARLVSPSGNNIFDFFNNVNNDRDPVTLIENGTYQLIVDSNGTTIGDFSFRLSDGNTAPILNFNSTLEGTLEPQTIQVLRFNGTANQNLTFQDLGSDSFGGQYRLIGPGNQLITSNSFGSGFDTTLPGDGTYLLLLDSYSDSLVDYRFRVI